jgi:hypothetical protein
MKTMDWGKVVASRPKDMTAAVVRDGIGEAPVESVEYLAQVKSGACSNTRPACVPFGNFIKRHPDLAGIAPDYTGAAIPGAAVIGVAAGKDLRWILRCLGCGNFLTRRARNLTRCLSLGVAVHCPKCLHRARLRTLQTKKGRAAGPDLDLAKKGPRNGE